MTKLTILTIGTLTALSIQPASADDTAWKAAMIKDAIQAAPPSITDDASIYAWRGKNDFVKVRDGKGPYHCVASGSWSTRIGNPPLPYPDPLCADEIAWAFLSAMRGEANPLKPKKPYPGRPGMVWMLAGMNAPGGKVAHANNPEAEYRVTPKGKTVVRLSPHIMVMPMRIHGKQSLLGYQYDTTDPNASWVMAADTPIEHLMIHFSWEEAAQMMQPKQD